MNPIINRSFNKHPMSWDIIRWCLFHYSNSTVKVICCHKTIDDLPKHCPKKIHTATFKICYTAKMTTINKVTTVDTSKLQPVELVNMDVFFYNVTFIRGFTSMLTIVCEKTIIIWLFSTASKRKSLRIILCNMTTLMNKQHSWKRVRVDEDSEL